MKIALILSALIVLTLSVPKTDTDYLWPRPMNYTYDDEGKDLI